MFRVLQVVHCRQKETGRPKRKMKIVATMVIKKVVKSEKQVDRV